MIVAPSKTIILSSQGWTEKGSIWRLKIAGKTSDLIKVADEHVALSGGTHGYFTVSFVDQSFVAQIRHFESPDIAQAEVRIGTDGIQFSGDPSLFAFGKCDFIQYLDWQGKRPPRYMQVEPHSATVTLRPLSWFWDLPLDHGYQGIMDVVPSPDSNIKWMPMSRSSDVLCYNVADNSVAGWLSLAGRAGNPRIQPYQRSWLAMDYDTLVQFNPNDDASKRMLLMQPETITDIAPGYRGPMRQFVGDFFVDGKIAYVARPFSGDVAVVNLTRWKFKTTVPVGGQPLEVACIGNRLYTRDWKTGELRVTPI